MKTKSVFISTIAIVVLLAVAIATGTYAWYTAQDSVNVNNATVSASASSDAAIGVGWDAADNATAQNVLFGESNEIRPMIPVAKPADSETGMAAFTYKEALLLTDGGVTKINSVQGTNPWKQKSPNLTPEGEPSYTDDLFVKNLNDNTAFTITVTITINGHTDGNDNNNILRVALWVSDDASGVAYIGTWALAGDAYACDLDTYIGGEATAYRTGEDGTANKFTTVASGSPSGTTFNLAGDAHRQVYVHAWFEGHALTTYNNTLNAGFSVNFSAAVATP